MIAPEPAPLPPMPEPITVTDIKRAEPPKVRPAFYVAGIAAILAAGALLAYVLA